jgi:trigger factor
VGADGPLAGAQGIPKETYLRSPGSRRRTSIADGKAEAEKTLRREAVLAAVIEAEGIESTEQELLEAVTPTAERERTTPKKLLERLRSGGRLDDLRRDLATRKALDVLTESATPITVEQAQARDKLWTPGEPATERSGQPLWTPGA